MSRKVALITGASRGIGSALAKEFAQNAANCLAGAGIKYIWNFTPCILDVPKDVKVWNENLIGSFLQFTNSDEV